MHENELPIDDSLVRDLIRTQHAHWSDLPLSRVPSSGTVHTMYRLGTDLAVRLPRLPEFSDSLERESDLLPRLGPLLPLRIPELVAVGEPTDAYPSTWTILRWLEGDPIDAVGQANDEEAAAQLGDFVTCMRSISFSGPVSTNQRAQPIDFIDDWVRESISTASAEASATDLLTVWESSLAAPPWNGTKTWVHADLMPGNLLVNRGDLSAVIDFGECAVGNPTYDFIAGWWVFDEPARSVFREASGADDSSWHRARGLALGGAVGALAYYSATNPSFSQRARTTIRRVIADAKRL